MPIAKIEIDSILGLTTSRNETSGINSPAWSSMSAWATENASSGATQPNTLLDCANITISRNKQAAARTAFTEVWDFTSTYGSVASFHTAGMYAIPNSGTNSIIYAWVNSTTADIGNFSNSVDQVVKSTEYIIGNTVSTDFSSHGYLLTDFSWQALSSTSEFPIKSFNLARFSTSYSNIYVFSSNGVFRTAGPYIASPTAAVNGYNTFKRVTLPVVRSLSATLTPSPSDAARWFPSGQWVDIQIVVTDQLSATQVYQGKPSRPLTVINTNVVTSILLTFSVDNTNLFTGSAGIGVYRTKAYAPKDPPPTDLYKCYEAALSAGTTASNVTTFTNIELTLNDTSIAQFEKLYTDINAESILSTTLAASAESSAPPTARDVVEYNNFTVYGNVMCPPFAALTMTALPLANNPVNPAVNDQLTVGATTVSLTYTPNSTTPPADDGVIDAVTGTYKGTNSSPNSGKGYHVVIRPNDPSTQQTNTSYSVNFYAVASIFNLTTGGSTATQDVVVTPNTTTYPTFDIAQFPTTGGFIAVTQSPSLAYIVALFSYESYTQDTAAGTYTFSNCLAYGVPFSDNTWTGSSSMANSLKTAGAFPMYALFGTSVSVLDVYPIGSDPTGYSNQKGFSLLPTYNFVQNFVGRVTTVSQNGVSAVGNGWWSPVLASIDFGGVYALQSGELLNQAAINLCDAYNLARTPEDPYAVLDTSTTAPAGRVRFESLYSGYNRNSAYANNVLYTFGKGYYDAIKAKVWSASTTPTVKFAEPIPSFNSSTGTPLNIMQQIVQTVAGLTVSKINKPEEIPIGQNLTPTIVGDPLKPIIKLVNQYNQLLIFKQNEGTYRTDIQPQGNALVMPVLNILTLIDNTAWLLLPESVQVFEGAVVYFSNKAFVTISSAGQVSEISPTIATELLENYETIFSNGDIDKVRSWTITQQRLYCCFFPNINDDNSSTTYVFSFNTGQWTKWTGEINDVAVSASGVMSLSENIFGFLDSVGNQNSLEAAQIDPDNKYWSVLRQANFQNPSTSQIEDVISLHDFHLDLVNENNVALTITISNFNSSSVYGNVDKILMLWKNRTIWYLSSTLGYFSTILTGATATEITLQLVDNIYQQNPIVPVGFSVVGTNSPDSLITTVNTAIYFNKFFIATPRGSTISHYNEVQLYMQQGINYSNLAVGFNSTEGSSQLIYTGNNPQPPTTPVTPPNAAIVTTSGSFVILNSTTYDIFTPYYVLAQSQYAFRVLVPLNSARGRFLQIALLHDTPDEVFIMNSVAYIYRDLNSTKIKAHSSSNV